MNSRDILVKARSLIELGGHVQGHYHRLNPDGVTESHCVYGAIFYASGSTEDFPHSPGIDQAIDAMENAVKSNVSLVLWNDDLARTKEEVLDAFDRAIASLPTEGT